MTMTRFVVLVACLLSVASAQVLDGLKVTWGINPLSKYTFADIPRTVADATEDGWIEIKDGCDGSTNFFGRRYVAYDEELGAYDHSVMPIYDVNGFIAGIQGAIPDNLDNGFPAPSIRPPFQHDADLGMYTMTAYFVDPSIICTTGRTQQDFDVQGTGDRVVFQNGKELLAHPNFETDIGTTAWTKGQCFYTMGQHYWYNITLDLECDDAFPSFLLYNDGRLNAFGWAYQGVIKSPRHESIGPDQISTFLPDVFPKCFLEIPAYSTMHIYLTDSPRLSFC